MTPEERAGQTVTAHIKTSSLKVLEAMIADAIRAAVLAEREVCARIIENHVPVQPNSELWGILTRLVSQIKARTAKEEGATSTAESESADPPTAP